MSAAVDNSPRPMHDPAPQPGQASGGVTTPLGVVVIGRNEGPRLRLCLESVLRFQAPIIYADSGSSDGSPDQARALGIPVVELDPERPFTAARGRNEGFERLAEAGAPEFLQFVDGDCELAATWPSEAIAALRANPRLALVCGRLREKHRDASIYARLCDMEWQGRPGPIESCGGIFMIRTKAFRERGGFIVGHVAGEEPDLCARLARAGWSLERLDVEMGTHDADMHRFGQWWRRAVRAGWAFAKAASLGSAERSVRSLRRVASTLAWAVALPAFAIAALILDPWPIGGLVCGLVIALYTALFLRIRGHRLRAGNTREDAVLYAAFCILGKWAESLGFVRYWVGR